MLFLQKAARLELAGAVAKHVVKLAISRSSNAVDRACRLPDLSIHSMPMRWTYRRRSASASDGIDFSHENCGLERQHGQTAPTARNPAVSSGRDVNPADDPDRAFRQRTLALAPFGRDAWVFATTSVAIPAGESPNGENGYVVILSLHLYPMGEIPNQH